MCNKMSINTADFAALAVTIVLFAVIYYLDYKKGVDFGLLTLLGTVFGIAEIGRASCRERVSSPV